MYQLTVNTVEGKESYIPLQQEKTTLGRDPSNDIPLSDPLTSRYHAEVIQDEEGFRIIDLNSKNGVYVNEEPIVQVRLHPNDVIRIGRTTLTFQEESTKSVIFTDSQFFKPDTSTIRLVQDIDTKFSKPKETLSDVRAQMLIQKKLIESLSQLSKRLTTSFDVGTTLEEILEIIFGLVPAERGSIILRDQETGELEPKAVKGLKGSDRMEVSKTIINDVEKNARAILTHDASGDFPDAQSIPDLQIRSVMCVPLRHDDRGFGTIFLSNSFHRAFSQDDLEILTLFANHAAIALEEARMKVEDVKRKRQITRLRKYFAPDLIEILLEDEELLKMRETEATILFTDIVRFTNFVERRAPEEVALVLNTHFSDMVRILFAHEGTIGKFTGDGFMAVFGAPRHREDHAVRAVRCAKEMIEHMQELAREQEVALQLRVGINTGEVCAGNIGGDTFVEYTVVGDAVNVAKRLEEKSAVNSITIGEPTYQRIHEQFETVPLGDEIIKDHEPVAAYRIVWESDPEAAPDPSSS